LNAQYSRQMPFTAASRWRTYLRLVPRTGQTPGGNRRTTT